MMFGKLFIKIQIMLCRLFIRIFSLFEMLVCLIAYTIGLSLPFVIIYALIFKMHLLPLFTLILFI